MREQPVNVFLTEQGQEVIRYALFYIFWELRRYAALVSEAEGSTSAGIRDKAGRIVPSGTIKVNIHNAVVTGQ